ncbi:MAG: hypothetical protein HY908_18520 [Myxococcales bacterium]|nr:hypothetical protein [Myxococcales bacterium]
MRRVACLLGALLCACEGDGPGCREPAPLDYFQSGSYTSPGGEAVDWFCTSGCSAVLPPHDGVGPLALALDLASDTVTVSYLRQGKAVVETWRVTSRASH